MYTLPPSNEHLTETPEGQTPISKTMKLVIAGCIALGVLDAYDDYRAFAEENSRARVSQSHK